MQGSGPVSTEASCAVPAFPSTEALSHDPSFPPDPAGPSMAASGAPDAPPPVHGPELSLLSHPIHTLHVAAPAASSIVTRNFGMLHLHTACGNRQAGNVRACLRGESSSRALSNDEPLAGEDYRWADRRYEDEPTAAFL